MLNQGKDLRVFFKKSFFDIFLSMRRPGIRLTRRFCYRWFSAALSLIFAVNAMVISVPGYAQSLPFLPPAGAMVQPSSAFDPVTILGMTIHPDNPFKFDFIVDTGDEDLKGLALKAEVQRLINYFFTTLTVPEDQLWVNLSPYEKDRVIAQGLGQTEMGRDMLAQDYLLKQLTASLLYPEQQLGSAFWEKVQRRAREEFGTEAPAVDTFHKVWIVPDQASVHVNGPNVFVANTHFTVMLERDYHALYTADGMDADALKGRDEAGKNDSAMQLQDQVMRELVIPAIESEVNEGKNFAPLRQMFHSLILAVWYKRNLKNSLLGRAYADQNKIKGVDLADPALKEKIYQQYVAAFEKGVFNYIKEDLDADTQEVIPRQYFSGGLALRPGDLGDVSHGSLPDKPGRTFNFSVVADRGSRDAGASSGNPSDGGSDHAAISQAGLYSEEEIRHVVEKFKLWQRAGWLQRLRRMMLDQDPDVVVRAVAEYAQAAQKYPDIFSSVKEDLQEVFHRHAAWQIKAAAVSAMVQLGERDAAEALAEKAIQRIKSSAQGDLSPDQMVFLGSVAEIFPETFFDSINRVLREVVSNRLIPRNIREAAIYQWAVLVTIPEEEERKKYAAEVFDFLRGLFGDRPALDAEGRILYEDNGQERHEIESRRVLEAAMSVIQTIIDGSAPEDLKQNLGHAIFQDAMALIRDQRTPRRVVAQAIMVLAALLNMTHEETFYFSAKDEIERVFNDNEERSTLNLDEFQVLGIAKHEAEKIAGALKACRAIKGKRGKWRRSADFEMLGADFFEQFPGLAEHEAALNDILKAPSGRIHKAGIAFFGSAGTINADSAGKNTDRLFQILKKGGSRKDVEAVAEAIRTILSAPAGERMIDEIIGKAQSISGNGEESLEARYGALLILEFADSRAPLSGIREGIWADQILKTVSSLITMEGKKKIRVALLELLSRIAVRQDDFRGGDGRIFQAVDVNNIIKTETFSAEIVFAAATAAIAAGIPLDEKSRDAVLKRLSPTADEYSNRLSGPLNPDTVIQGLSLLRADVFFDDGPAVQNIARFYFRSGQPRDVRSEAASVLAQAALGTERRYSGQSDSLATPEQPQDQEDLSRLFDAREDKRLVRAFRDAVARQADSQQAARQFLFFEGYIKGLKRHQVRRLLEFGLSFAQDGVFDAFFDGLREVKFQRQLKRNDFENFERIEQSLENAFVEAVGLDDVIEDRMKQGYAGVRDLLYYAASHAVVRRYVVNAVIVYRQMIDKRYASKSFFEFFEDDIQLILPELKKSFLQLLDQRDLKTFEIHRLARVLPFGNMIDIERLRESARRLAMAFGGTQEDFKQGLLGQIRVHTHENKITDEELIDALERWIASGGGKGRKTLRKFGYTVTEDDVKRLHERPQEIRKAFDDYQAQWLRIYGRNHYPAGGHGKDPILEDIARLKTYLQHLEDFQTIRGDLNQRFELIRSNRIESLSGLKNIVDIRKDLQALIHDPAVHADLLYYLVNLDTALEARFLAVYDVLIADKKEDPKASKTGLLSLLLEDAGVNEADVTLGMTNKALNFFIGIRDVIKEEKKRLDFLNEQGYEGRDLLKRNIDFMEEYYWKRMRAIVRRVKRSGDRVVEQANDAYQQLSEKIWTRLNIPEGQPEFYRAAMKVKDDLPSATLRAEVMSRVGQAVEEIEDRVRRHLTLPDVDFVSPGVREQDGEYRIRGKIRVIHKLKDLKAKPVADNEILVFLEKHKEDRLEDFPVGARRGIFVHRAIGRDAHPAVLAQSNHLPLLRIRDEDFSRELQKLDGQWVVISNLDTQKTPGIDVTDHDTGTDRFVVKPSETGWDEEELKKAVGADIPWFIDADDPQQRVFFNSKVMGVKAVNLRELYESDPVPGEEKVSLGVLPYRVEHDILNADANAAVMNQVNSLFALFGQTDQDESDEIDRKIVDLFLTMQIPGEMIRTIMDKAQAGIPQGERAIFRSAGVEDLGRGKSSGGGVNHSEPDVDVYDAQSVRRAILLVMASRFLKKAYDDRQRNNYPHEYANMSIIVMRQVSGFGSAVGQSQIPENPNVSSLSMVAGFGETAVDGKDQYPNRFLRDRDTKTIQIATFADYDFVLKKGDNGELERVPADLTEDPFWQNPQRVRDPEDSLYQLQQGIFDKMLKTEDEKEYPQDMEFVVTGTFGRPSFVSVQMRDAVRDENGSAQTETVDGASLTPENRSQQLAQVILSLARLKYAGTSDLQSFSRDDLIDLLDRNEKLKGFSARERDYIIRMLESSESREIPDHIFYLADAHSRLKPLRRLRDAIQDKIDQGRSVQVFLNGDVVDRDIAIEDLEEIRNLVRGIFKLADAGKADVHWLFGNNEVDFVHDVLALKVEAREQDFKYVFKGLPLEKEDRRQLAVDAMNRLEQLGFLAMRETDAGRYKGEITSKIIAFLHNGDCPASLEGKDRDAFDVLKDLYARAAQQREAAMDLVGIMMERGEYFSHDALGHFQVHAISKKKEFEQQAKMLDAMKRAQQEIGRYVWTWTIDDRSRFTNFIQSAGTRISRAIETWHTNAEIWTSGAGGAVTDFLGGGELSSAAPYYSAPESSPRRIDNLLAAIPAAGMMMGHVPVKALLNIGCRILLIGIHEGKNTGFLEFDARTGLVWHTKKNDWETVTLDRMLTEKIRELGRMGDEGKGLGDEDDDGADEAETKADEAAMTKPNSVQAAADKKHGGIDFNPRLFDLEDQNPEANMNVFDNTSFAPDLQIEGLVPVIINVTPVTNLPQLLGYEDENPEHDTESSSKQMRLSRNDEPPSMRFTEETAAVF